MMAFIHNPITKSQQGRSFHVSQREQTANKTRQKGTWLGGPARQGRTLESSTPLR
jgi:hypothetical protein